MYLIWRWRNNYWQSRDVTRRTTLQCSFVPFKFNEHGRYISFGAVHKENKFVIITPEVAFKGGWNLIAQWFLTSLMTQLRRRRRHWWTLISVNGNLRRKKLSVITDGRLWVRKSPIICSSARIRAPGGTTISEKDVLLGSSRGCHKKPWCFVGKFRGMPQEAPTLNDIRRWALQLMEECYGGNRVCDNDALFHYELPSGKAAEYVLTGDWSWRKTKLLLDWWNPTSGCWPWNLKRDWVWIRITSITR